MTQRHFTGISEPAIHNPRGRGDFYAYRRGMGIMPAAEYLHFFDDFAEKITTNVPFRWGAAIIDTSATITEGATAGTDAAGVIIIAGGGSASQGAATYLNASKALQITAGKSFYMEIYAQCTNVADMDLQFGLTDLTATTNPEDLWTTTAANVVAFGLLAGSAYPTMLSDKSNSGTTAQAQTAQAMSNATWTRLGIGYDGSNLSGWVNGNLALNWSGAAATVPTGVALTPFVGARCGATTTDTARIDYVRFALAR